MTRLTRTLTYGCMAPVEGNDLAREQMHAGHRYYNDLVALERARRAAYREVRSNTFPEIAGVEERTAILAKEIARLRAAEVSSDEARTLRGALREAQRLLSALKKAVRVDAGLTTRAREIDERYSVLLRALRANTSAEWGTYLLAERAFSRAKSSKREPAFRSARGWERVVPVQGWCAEGSLGVLLIRGRPLTQVLEGRDSFLQLDRVPASAWNSTSRSERRRLMRTTLRIRVGSEPGNKRATRWAVFPMIMDRPIPSDALIKAVTVQLKVVGTSERWLAHIAFETERPEKSRNHSVLRTIAVDLGCGELPDGNICVACWVDDDGSLGQVILDAPAQSRMLHAEYLRARRQAGFRRAQSWLRRWSSAAKTVGTALPSYFEEAVASRLLHTSASHLRQFVLQVWRHKRFAGDQRVFGTFERWAHRSRRLHQWSASEARKASAERRERYRLFAAEIAREYAKVVLCTPDLMALRKASAVDDPQAARSRRRQLLISAPGELRDSLSDAIAGGNGELVVVPAASSHGEPSHEAALALLAGCS